MGGKHSSATSSSSSTIGYACGKRVYPGTYRLFDQYTKLGATFKNDKIALRYPVLAGWHRRHLVKMFPTHLKFSGSNENTIYILGNPHTEPRLKLSSLLLLQIFPRGSVIPAIPIRPQLHSHLASKSRRMQGGPF